MANKKATMTDLRLLIREFIKGTSKRKISEILNLSRTSIDVYLGRMDASGKSAEELLHSDDKTLSQVMVRDSGKKRSISTIKSNSCPSSTLMPNSSIISRSVCVGSEEF
jgi:hypothetical protein